MNDFGANIIINSLKTCKQFKKVTSFYAILIKKELIEAFDSPATFTELYNEAASRRNKRGGQEYLLSKEMARYLHQVE